MSQTAATLVADASQDVIALTPKQFALQARSPRAVVVDLREADERVAAGTIRGSALVPRGLLEFAADPSSPQHDDRLQPDREVLLYCSDGSRSALAASTLLTLGYRTVAHLEGGLEAWTRAGFPVDARFTSPY
jgi:rhodanese-related sulfurtransferase